MRNSCLTTSSRSPYAIQALAKSKAEPRNSNLYKAYSNTPLNACFFMRSTNTPKESVMQICTTAFLSMVACYGKGFALCCVPCIAVFEPVTRYRPKASKLQVVTLNNQYKEIAMKLFIFAAICRTDLTNKIQKIRIFAETEMQARAKLAKQFILIFAGCINVQNLAKNHRTLSPIPFTSAIAEVCNG